MGAFSEMRSVPKSVIKTLEWQQAIDVSLKDYVNNSNVQQLMAL